MSLDKKLEEILLSYAGKPEFENPQQRAFLNDKVAQIKQAFADDGYVTPDNAKKVQGLANQMHQLAIKSMNMPVIQPVAYNKKQQTYHCNRCST